MRILYIAFENPAVSTILEGMNDDALWGLPAFYYPFKMLVERGHTVDVLLLSDKDFDVTPSKYFNASNLILVKLTKKGLLGKFEIPYRLVKAVRKLLKARHYDFVYGMSEGAYPGVAAAYKMGVPCALRLFGTREMSAILEKKMSLLMRRLIAFKDYPYITLALRGKMCFLLTTNDGSHADDLYNILGIRKKNYNFYFWRSGIYIPTELPVIKTDDVNQYPLAYSSFHLSHIGRIASEKHQDRSVRILGELHKRGYPMHLHLVGNLSGKTMYEMTMGMARELGIEDYVHIVGNQPQIVCRQYARNSLVTLLVADLNRGNVFYEVMSEGALLLTNNNHSLDGFIEPAVNCLVYEEDNYEQAADIIISLLNDPERMKSIRSAAYHTAVEKFMSLEKRFGMEVRLVEETAAGSNVDEFPSVL